MAAQTARARADYESAHRETKASLGREISDLVMDVVDGVEVGPADWEIRISRPDSYDPHPIAYAKTVIAGVEIWADKGLGPFSKGWELRIRIPDSQEFGMPELTHENFGRALVALEDLR
jgi:hypothetical protein